MGKHLPNILFLIGSVLFMAGTLLNIWRAR
jgi:hypothetical protein